MDVHVYTYLLLLFISLSINHEYDVMLSYQWGSQAFVKEIKSFLETNGLRVWMDVKEMYGNMNIRMKQAINHSKIMLLFITKKYEDSHNCQKEFNYADQLKKKIIPVKLEVYEPESELALIITNKLYHTFFDKNGKELEEGKEKLLWDIKQQL